MKSFFLLSILICFSLPVQAEPNGPTVVELFTSQSCSSCPPADKILNKLSKQKNIIALSCNVTYWNHLNWKDTLSKDFCTNRQRQYVEQLKANSSYTPQIVVNGRDEMIGSQKKKVSKAVKSAQKNNPVENIEIFDTQSIITVQLPSLSPGEYFVHLLTYGADHTQDIPSGENSGRVVTYTNPVQELVFLQNWDGKRDIIQLNKEQFAPAQGYVVLVQEKSAGGPIVAAGRLAL